MGPVLRKISILIYSNGNFHILLMLALCKELYNAALRTKDVPLLMANKLKATQGLKMRSDLLLIKIKHNSASSSAIC